MSRVFDCFMVNDEVELIELRLHTLVDVVDEFICVESPTTHSGKPRPLLGPWLRRQFARWPIRQVLTLLPAPHPDRWLPERMQRNAMAAALIGTAEADDLILMSDVDEIPDPANVRHVGTHWMRCFIYYLNALKLEAWPGTIGLPFAELQFMTPAGWRAQTGGLPRIAGGWHFSYQGGVDRMRNKLASFGHAEFDCASVHADLPQRMTALEDPFGRPAVGYDRCRILPLDDTFPRYLRDHPERFPGMIAEPPLSGGATPTPAERPA